jgi:hypothetical protein
MGIKFAPHGIGMLFPAGLNLVSNNERRMKEKPT